MIRTRDFLLYILVFAFILIGIAFTINADKKSGVVTAAKDQFVAQDGLELAAQEREGIDRNANLALLREKLKNGEGAISQGDPIFTSVDTVVATETEEITDDTPITTGRSEMLCAVQNDTSALTTRWARAKVSEALIEGVRVYTLTEETMVIVGSSTEATTTSSMILQLPVMPTRNLQASCMGSSVIGVAVDHSLIQNSDTWRFRNAGVDTVVGYALDGHPIYGPGVDETLLDACGGYDTGAGYQYHLRESDLFMLGCFAATPAVFRE